MVVCKYCGATVGSGQEAVRAADFRAAADRARAEAATSWSRLDCEGICFRLLERISENASTEIYRAEALAPARALVCLKLRRGASAARTRREAEVLRTLHASTPAGVANLTRRLPFPIACGTSAGPHGVGCEVLALRHPPFAWGSLAQLNAAFPSGLDPAHTVWIWRRILESLSFVHAAGYVHGELRLDHLLIHPEEHLVHLIGWADAQPLSFSANSDRTLRAPTIARDLAQSAWVIRALIAGTSPGTPAADRAPEPLRDLLERVAHDPHGLSAHDLDAQVRAAARAAFGPPRFLHLNLPKL